MKKVFYLLFAFLAVAVSCNMQDGTDSGNVRVALPGSSRVAYTESEIVRYEVVVTNEYGKSISEYGNPGETVVFNRVSAGNCTVDVYALDNSGYTGAHGSSSVTVEKDRVATVPVTASFLQKSNFFVSGEDGVWLSDWRSYFNEKAPCARFKSFRNDVDFFTAWEQYNGGDSAWCTSVRLKNDSLPYVYLNYTGALPADYSSCEISFHAKATVPGTVNFYTQNASKEVLGVLCPVELTSEWKPCTIPVYQPNGCILRAMVTPENGIVSICDDTIDFNYPPDMQPLTVLYTSYPPGASGVKITHEGNAENYTEFKFTDTDVYGGFVCRGGLGKNANAPGSHERKFNMGIYASEPGISLTAYRYSFDGLKPIKTYQMGTSNNSHIDITFSCADDEDPALLFKVNKPTTITVSWIDPGI